MENPQNPLAGRVPDVEPSARVAASTATRPDDATPDWRGRPFLGQPGPLANLFSVELWERFSFYGMQGIVLLYMYWQVADGGLGIDSAVATGIVGAYGGTVYLCAILGGWVADHLTGSERAGSVIGALAGQHLKKAVLELGGSDPYIVLDAEDPAEAARTAWATRMYNMGQACNSNKRMIVSADIHDAFVAELVSLAEAMKPGEAADEDPTVFTPLSSRGAAEGLAEQVDRARQQGATVHVGGTVTDEAGARFAPAVITGVTSEMDAYREELFGPVAVVYKVESADEALALANDSQYGLGGAVFSTDLDEARRVADQLEVGMANVNLPSAGGANLPFGGVKRSGFGRELGPDAPDAFTETKNVFFATD